MLSKGYQDNVCSITDLKREINAWIDTVPKLNGRIPMTACAKMMEEISELMLALHSDELGDPGEECADIAIILIDIVCMLNIDLSKEILKKIEVLKTREWEVSNGLLRHK